MDDTAQTSVESDLDQLRQALEVETARRLELQQQLDLANAGFEDFISMAAHNLREPLRDVAAFSQLLVETSGELDPETAEYLDRIRQGAARIQSVLASIVDYWAGVGGTHGYSRVDMEAALAQALLRADRRVVERSAIVTHDPLPAITGDFELLTKVLQHLIENAVAYGGAHCPRVHISCKPLEHGWEFSVQDNGLGIAPEYQERIFQPFKRLHGREYPGNGLGLTFCRKAVEGCGGRMRVESTLGAGSTFFFTAVTAI
jgi:light-regulated signal transduction histidine kinase (bacteriophytochrome)